MGREKISEWERKEKVKEEETTESFMEIGYAQVTDDDGGDGKGRNRIEDDTKRMNANRHNE